MTAHQMIPLVIEVPLGVWAVWGCVHELRKLWR